MLQLASIGSSVELRGRERDLKLTSGERLLLSNVRSGIESLSVCRVDREAKIVYPTDLTSMNTAEMPEGYCLSTKVIWARTLNGEDLLFPGDYCYGLMEKGDLVDLCRVLSASKRQRTYVMDNENLRMVYAIDRVTLSDENAIKIALKFKQRFPVYGLKGGSLTKVIYQGECLTGENIAIWKIGIKNVIWSPMAKLLLQL